MSRARVPVLAVVVVTRAGGSLARALDSVAWATERAVLDPAGEVAAQALPPDVRLARDATQVSTLGTAPWMLLLAEHEVAAAGLEADVARIAGQGASGGRRVSVEVDTFGVRLVPRYAAVRLAPRETACVVVERGLELGLTGRQGDGQRLATGLCASRGASIDEAVTLLGTESGALSVLLARQGPALGVVGITLSAMTAAARLFLARAPTRPGIARLLAVVFAGYRVVLANARAWEWRRAQRVALREIG
jgi:hypothetical protein